MSRSVELDALPCPVIISDLTGQIMFINQCAVNTFAIQQPQETSYIEQLFPPAAKILLQTHLWPILRKDGCVKEFYLKIKREPMTALPVLLNVQKGSFLQQECYHWVILPAEQRARFEQELLNTRQQLQQFAKVAESSRQLLQTVMDGAKDIAILAVTSNWTIQFASMGAEILFLETNDRLLGMDVLSFFERDRLPIDLLQIGLPSDTMMIAEPSLVRRVDPFETILVRGNGERIHVEMTVRPLAQTVLIDDIQFILEVTDISQRKKYQQLQDDFIATISHELRTPLTVILGSLNLVQSGKLGDIPQGAQKLIDMTVSNAKRLKHLINDVLDFSKLKATSISIELAAVPLAPLLENALSEHRYYLADKNVRLLLAEVDSTCSVNVDPQRFMQVISNLLSNAIKFSPQSAQVSISSTVDDSFVTIAIEDQGSGIKADFLPYLFTQFRQQDSATNRKFEGTGLGLAISKSLVEAMGGTIGYKTSSHGGAIFWFRVFRSDNER